MHIRNIAVSTGVFLERIKLARIGVIAKGGSENHLNNYRSISILALFSNIAEKVIYKRLTNDLNATNIAPREQFGFQKSKLTEMAFLNLRNKVINNPETYSSAEKKHSIPCLVLAFLYLCCVRPTRNHEDSQ